MLKFPEAPDRKRGEACAKKETSRQKKIPLTFCSDWCSDNI